MKPEGADRWNPRRANQLSRRYCAVSRAELAEWSAAAGRGGVLPILFDPDFYREDNEDVQRLGIDPLEHYLGGGAVDGRMPIPDIRPDKLHPLVAALHRLDPTSAAATAYDPYLYRHLHPDLAAMDDEALTEHYVQHGQAERRVDSLAALAGMLCDDPREIPLDFDPEEYAGLHAEHLADLKGRPLQALLHYMLNGRWERRAYSIRALWEGASVRNVRRPNTENPRGRHVVDAGEAIDPESLPAKLIAFYLPQFHPIPENDEWWGKGFTEWTNVTKARPNYRGHYQPRLPADLGFYDLRIPEVMEQQAELARRYGVYGFCYHYYWFGGRRLLELPIERMLETGRPDFPFCLSWANENWTRRWDGAEDEILLAQTHGEEDDRAVIRDLMRYFRSPSYIRIGGKPLLLLYRAALLPDVETTVERWREACREEGIGEIYLAMVASFQHAAAGADPTACGMDAIVEYPPHVDRLEISKPHERQTNPRWTWKVTDYAEFARAYSGRRSPEHVTRFRGVMPDWDNTARRQDNSHVFHGASPEAYGHWLQTAIKQTVDSHPEDERLVFINAWNEWAEGAYLEPDRKFGFAYLAATRAALEGASRRRGSGASAALPAPAAPPAVSERLRSSFAGESPEPLVSIVIPMYGQLPHTLRCLESIAASPPSASFEVILVDDGSPDDPAEVLRSIRGLRLVARPENQGFIRACNDGARTARGEYLCFLNNDTEVRPGWLDALLRTFHDFPGTGLVGSKLIYPDGVLQEAGGILWQDGTAANFGRGEDASLPVYGYAREVDYCSGASILIPRSLFEESGGFDEHYLPAYCEDCDLALKVRERGLRVVYQPHSVVVHHEGVTSGTDVTRGVKAWQPVNGRKLYERWRDRLARHQPPGEDVDAAKDRTARHRALVLDHATPTPDQDAGSITVLNTMLLLRDMGFQVTFLAEYSYLYGTDYTAALQRSGIETPRCPSHESIEEHLKGSGGRYDLIIVCRVEVTERYENLARIRRLCPRARVLFWTADLFHLRIAREAKVLGDGEKKKEAARLRKAEFASIRNADATVVHSPVERGLILRGAPKARVHVVPLALDVPGTSRTFGEREDFVFLGDYRHSPNVDAVHHFVEAILPRLRETLPGVRFHIAGGNAPAEIREHGRAPDVVVTGHVDDLQGLFDRMRAAVAPLRYGAGVKGKICAAMGAGLPGVATSLAAEGMGLTDGEDVLIADDPEAFADALTRIYREEALWKRISQAGLELAERAWGAEAGWKALADALNDLGFAGIERGAHALKLYSGD